MKRLFFIIPLVVLFITGCSEDSTEPVNGEGRIKMHLADAPSEIYDEVNIVVERVEVHQANNGNSESGWIVLRNEPDTYDLLELTNGASVILGDTALSAGHYTQIRLIIGEGSNIVIDGIEHLLTIPSGMQSGLKLNHEFTINDGELYELLLDFDVKRSIVVTGNLQYKLKPVIRVTPFNIAGLISGRVLPQDAEVTVWAFWNNNVDTTSTFTTGQGFFKLIAMPEATYTLYFAPANPIYKDTVLTDIEVNINQNTDVGTITLELQ